MTSEEIVEKVKAGLANVIQDISLPQGDAVIFVASDSLPAVAEYLKNDQKRGLTFTCCTKNVSRAAGKIL